MTLKILGIHIGHDSSACVIIDGKIIAASPEERFTRDKNDACFPINAINFSLKESNLRSEEIDLIAVPNTSLEREHSTFLNLSCINLYKDLKSKFRLKTRRFIANYLGINRIPSGEELPIYMDRPAFKKSTKIHFCHHHLAHASSAYYTSGFNKNEKSLIVTMDGVGGGISTAIWLAKNHKISALNKYNTDGSLGLFYSNATESLGWRQASDEWKLMGLAPYGEVGKIDLSQFHPHFSNGKLLKPYPYKKGAILREGRSNHPHSPEACDIKNHSKNISREDFAAQVQYIAEQEALKLIIPQLEKNQVNNLAVAGGCFMNIKLNGLLRDHKKVQNFWVYPDAGDAGLSIGAALHAHYENSEISHPNQIHKLDHLYYGPQYNNEQIKKELLAKGIKFEKHENITEVTAELLAQNLTIGWFQGRMEIGPRALGNRSIIMSPINPKNKNIINAKIKYRENFRPFCPSILEEEVNYWIENPKEEKFMASAYRVLDKQASKIPAVVHVDQTIRPQFVSKKTNNKYHNLISNFFKITKVPLLLNTSFNVKGEPIVCSPTDALRCFYSCGLDILVIGDYLIKK